MNGTVEIDVTTEGRFYVAVASIVGGRSSLGDRVAVGRSSIAPEDAAVEALRGLEIVDPEVVPSAGPDSVGDSENATEEV